MKYSIVTLLGSVALGSAGFRPEALGPLSRITDLNKFELDMRRVKASGAGALALDIWWAWVEPKDNQFDWTYYDELVKRIIAAGLKWIPILSTHQCGAPGDPNCYIPIPSWTNI